MRFFHGLTNYLAQNLPEFRDENPDVPTPVFIRVAPVETVYKPADDKGMSVFYTVCELRINGESLEKVLTILPKVVKVVSQLQIEPPEMRYWSVDSQDRQIVFINEIEETLRSEALISFRIRHVENLNAYL